MISAEFNLFMGMMRSRAAFQPCWWNVASPSKKRIFSASIFSFPTEIHGHQSLCWASGSKAFLLRSSSWKNRELWNYIYDRSCAYESSGTAPVLEDVNGILNHGISTWFKIQSNVTSYRTTQWWEAQLFRRGAQGTSYISSRAFPLSTTSSCSPFSPRQRTW